ncbi:MAG: hypothetical protein ABMA15_04465 [Vicinamibacterales bacterium]
MRNLTMVIGVAIAVALGAPRLAAAQTGTTPREAPAVAPVAHPTIQTVTVAAGGLLIISGTGFGADAAVTIEGQPVTVLPGGSATQLTVPAPASVLTTPGTYRLTVTVPGQPADVFVVVSQPGNGAAGLLGTTEAATRSRASGDGVANEGAHRPIVGPSAAAAPGPSVTEDFCNTAVGVDALSSVTTGCFHVAVGWGALSKNTTGTHNAASGDSALLFNTTGSSNTASGATALLQNTTGDYNTASGARALRYNTIGGYNSASGAGALQSNTTGSRNTATGFDALFANTTGTYNVGSGDQALGSNTTGNSNTATGAWALQYNTTGGINTATGVQALWQNTTGVRNMASGGLALSSNTTGQQNTASGAWALAGNTTGHSNAALGYNAGANATTGSYNVYVGAEVTGTAADTNAIRIGLPYSGGVGQNKTFIAGIANTPLDASNGVQLVWVDKNGQLGTLMQPASASGGAAIAQAGTSRQPQSVAPQGSRGAMDQLTRTVQAQQAVIADLRGLSQAQQAVIANLTSRLEQVEALLVPAAGRNVAR